MKKILLAFLFLFLVLFFSSAYRYYLVLHSDDPIVPYIVVEEGTATVVRGDIAIDMVRDDQYILMENDTIITPKSSLAIIKWPDKSETRLGSDSRMKIHRMQVSRDYSSIEIEFSLEKGQIWSTVVRTIYPGSYFRTKLPDQGVIAGVRGTVYDIDLIRGYVRSVDHSVTLSDVRGNTISLLPGELVSVTNILKKLGKEVVDQAWNTMNQTRDVLFLESHGASLRIQIDQLSGRSHNYWDRFVRWILSYIPAFEELSLFESLLSDGASMENLKISKEQFFAIYQKIQDTKFVQERDRLRTYILDQSSVLGLNQEQIQTLTYGALWDTISFSGITLQGADKIMENYIKSLDTQIQSVIEVVPIKELDSKARETLRQLIK